MNEEEEILEKNDEEEMKVMSNGRMPFLSITYHLEVEEEEKRKKERKKKKLMFFI